MITARSADDATRNPNARSVSAVVPKIDHRVGGRLESVVHVTDALKAQQQTAELVFLGEDKFDGPGALLEDRRIEAPLAATLWVFSTTRVLGDVRRHAAIEDRLAVVPAVVDAIQTIAPYIYSVIGF